MRTENAELGTNDFIRMEPVDSTNNLEYFE
jgi:hypothetical protein